MQIFSVMNHDALAIIKKLTVWIGNFQICLS